MLADGQPCPLRKGQTFRRWKSQLEDLGCHVDDKVLRASDYGTPTIRKRLFIVARCDGLPIRWPEPTHGDPKKIQQDLFSINLKPWRTAAECIDWSLPCPSIFERQRPLAENTLRRIAAGIRRFVIDTNEPFIVNMAHGGKLEDVNRPISTIATEKGGCRALVTPFIARTAHGDVDKNGKRRGKGQHSVGEPLHTVTASGDYAICTPFLAGVGGRAGQSPERSPDQPYQTITAKADAALVSPILVGAGGPARAGGPRPVDRPIGTQTTRNNTHLVTPLLVGTGGGLLRQASPCWPADEHDDDRLAGSPGLRVPGPAQHDGKWQTECRPSSHISIQHNHVKRFPPERRHVAPA
ncbi:MAG: DNA cytosine methyltransferase [Isosphaeraceae bacterium]